MEEDDWLDSTDPEEMLAFLEERGMLSERKARLLGCAAVRRVWHLLFDQRSRRAVEEAELYADRRKRGASLSATANAASQAADGPFDASPRAELGAYSHAAMAAWWLVNDGRACDAAEVCSRVYGATVCDPDDPEVEEEAQANLLRDLFGPLPFRRITLPRSVKAWNGGVIKRLAEEVYEHRLLPCGHLEPDRLAVLADALEEAGCRDQEILRHLRQQGAVHTRGCWLEWTPFARPKKCLP